MTNGSKRTLRQTWKRTIALPLLMFAMLAAFWIGHYELPYLLFGPDGKWYR